MEHSTIWILMCLFATQVRWVDADAYLLVVDVDNGTIYKGSILQGLTDLAPLPLDGVINPVAVDYDPVEGMVYWTDVGNPSPKISKAHLDGSGQMILVYELNVPGGLALDVTSRMVYWTDELGHIARIPMDGSGRKEIIVENIIRPRGIITDHDNGHIYWTDLGNNGTIERANLDGTDRTVIVQDNMLFPSGLAIDHRENKLYWCDSKLETIEQRDLSSNIRTVVIDLAPFNGTFFPFDLFLFNDNLYWTDWGTYTILRVSKRGTGEQHYGPAIFEKAVGIHIYEDFCDSAPCRNGATCTSSACHCAPGYGGNFCDLVLGCDLTHDASDKLTVDPYQLVYYPGQRVTFGCPDGYEFRGSAEWFCQTDFTWTENQAECIQLDFCDSSPCRNGGTCNSSACHCAPGYGGNICHLVMGCELTHDASDKLTVDPYQLVYLPGQQVTFGCPDGYEFRGSAVWFCQTDFTWTENQAECIQLDGNICESSPCVNGGTCTSLRDDITCQCAPGYEGNTCDLAKQGCSRPPPSKHMTMSETNSFFQPGEEVLLTCDNGYVIQGSNDHSIRRVCSAADGSWSGGEAQCVIDMEEGGSSYALIIGVASAVALVVVVLLIVLIFIKRKRTRRTNERVVHLPDVQTIYQGGQTNPQFQAVNPPPYQSRQPVYQDSIYSDLKDPSPYQQTSNL